MVNGTKIHDLTVYLTSSWNLKENIMIQQIQNALFEISLQLRVEEFNSEYIQKSSILFVLRKS